MCHTSEVGVLDAPRDVLWGLGQGTEQATLELKCCCQKTTKLHARMCVWDHDPAKRNVHSPPYSTFKAFLHSILQNFTVLFCIHLFLNLYKLSHPILPHTTPYHKIVSSSMFDSWCCSLVRYWFSLLLPDIYLPIWPNPIYFCLIWP